MAKAVTAYLDKKGRLHATAALADAADLEVDLRVAADRCYERIQHQRQACAYYDGMALLTCMDSILKLADTYRKVYPDAKAD